MNAAGFGASTFAQVGFRALKLRADDELSKMGVDGAMALQKKIESDWQWLKSEADQHSFRTSPNQLSNLSRKRPACIAVDCVTPSRKKSKTAPCPGIEGATARVTRKSQPSAASVTPTPHKPPAGLRRPGRNLPMKQTADTSVAKKKPHSSCSQIGCSCNNINTPKTKFHRIKAYPKPSM